MKVAVSSTLGNPQNPHTWSNAPAHLMEQLVKQGVAVAPIDSSFFTPFHKLVLAGMNAVRGYTVTGVDWFEGARLMRGKYLARCAKEESCTLILCTGTLDAPFAEDVEYGVWLDNTFALLQRSAAALPYSSPAVEEIARLERLALNGARMVLPFSEHVRESVIADYGVPPERVRAVGCGSGPLPPFEGEKNFSTGHLLFVAKHLFSSKGGDLVLEAFPIIRSERPGTRLILIGNEEARDKAAGIDGVEVHGYVARDVLNRYFHEAAMLVQPMLADPWGQVYLEAMKARAVVVSLRVAALPELTDNGRLGVLIDRPDARALADAVLHTFARPQAELDQLTREAQRRVARLHRWEAVGARVADALRPHLTAMRSH